MDGEAVFGIIMMAACGFGCAALFYGIGIWAGKRSAPMSFWSGTTVDPETVSDIPAYNRENGNMWKTFSLPFWITGISGLLSVFDMRFSVLALVMMLLACSGGVGWLLLRYKQICKRYIVR